MLVAIAHFRALVLAVWVAIHPTLPNRIDAPVIAEGIALAVANDDEAPLTESRDGDAALMASYVYFESSVNACPVPGDHGASHGAFQLQGVGVKRACDPIAAAPIWLRMAHRSVADCAWLPVKEQLAELVSGSCGRGRHLAAWRSWRSAKWLNAVLSAPDAELARAR